MAQEKYIVVFVTAKAIPEGRKIAQAVLKQRLAACVNIVPGVESHFWWDGKLDSSQEVLLIMKTRKTLFTKLAKAVKASHSYNVPEIIALPLQAGDKPYLDWIRKETK